MYKILVENSRDYDSYKVIDGTLEFVEEEVGGNIQELKLSFDNNLDGEIRRFKKLMVAVYNKITSLEFPDTSKYEETLDGIKEFEEDLIAGVI